MFGITGFSFIAGAIKKQLFDLDVYWRTELNKIDPLKTNRYLSWVSVNADVADCTVVYELFNGEPTGLNADKGSKAFKITIIRNDTVRGRTEISYCHKNNIPGLGLDIAITGPTDVEYMHEWLATLSAFIPVILSKLNAVPVNAFKVDYTIQSVNQ